jgi:hypothetical protein
MILLKINGRFYMEKFIWSPDLSFHFMDFLRKKDESNGHTEQSLTNPTVSALPMFPLVAGGA